MKQKFIEFADWIMLFVMELEGLEGATGKKFQAVDPYLEYSVLLLMFQSGKTPAEAAEMALTESTDEFTELQDRNLAAVANYLKVANNEKANIIAAIVEHADGAINAISHHRFKTEKYFLSFVAFFGKQLMELSDDRFRSWKDQQN